MINTAFVLFAVSMVSAIAAKVYHGFVFLPEYHGSFAASFKVLFSFDQGIAFFKDPIGFSFVLFMVVPLLVGMVLLFASSAIEKTELE